MNGHLKLDRWLLICLGLGAAAFLFIRPGALKSVAPYAVFLLCPLMHILMMGHMSHGHEGHGHERGVNAGGESTGSCHGDGSTHEETTQKESV